MALHPERQMAILLFLFYSWNIHIVIRAVLGQNLGFACETVIRKDRAEAAVHGKT